MRATKILLSIAVATMAACQTNQSGNAPLPGVVARAQFAPVSEAALEKHIAILSSDRFEGRGVGTPGGERTRAYLISEMRRLGLEPLGESYALPVTLVSRTLDLEQSKVHVAMGRRTRKGRTRDFDELSFGSEAVFWTRRDRGRVSLQASKLVFAGHGIVAPEYGWDDYAGVDVGGKTVIVLINDPGFRRGKAMSYYGRWTYKFEEAARQGADGVLVIHQTEPASYGWNVVSGPGSNRGLDLPAPPGSDQPLAIEGWITEEQAEALFDAAGADFAALEKAASQPGFQAQPLDGLSLSAELFQKRTKVLSANIAGVIPGTQRPDEYVLYTAHWDHLGVDENEIRAGRDGIYNGAADNATGTGGILAIAESWRAAGVKPRRSHVFLALTAEESGLLGAKAFVEEPPVPLSSIVAGINIDMFLPVGPSKDFIVYGDGSSEVEDILARVAAERSMVLAPDPVPQAGYFYRSDHVAFAKKGVPMLFGDNGLTLHQGGKKAGLAAKALFDAKHYHQVSDEYDPDDWRLDGIAQALTLLRDLGVELDWADPWPNWYKGNEFRATRDAALAGSATD